jgi:hypothetical protein
MRKIPLRFLLILAFVLLVSLFVIRFVVGGAEDNWICRDGVWVKHGNPSTSMPTGECKQVF